MEPKKNPKYDVHRYSKLTFLFSLAFSISLVLMAFQLKVETKDDVGDNPKPVEPVDYAFTEIKSITTPKPKYESVDKKIPDKKVADPTKVVEAIHAIIQPDDIPAIEDMNEPQQQSGFSLAEPMPHENAETIFIVVEKMPEPIGGLKGFYETISKNITYPVKAKRNGVEGKVLIEFVINEDDRLSDFKIISGIGAGCDEEAMRVIALTKWKAGKQRGKPVKVKMVLPLTFTLQ